MGITDFLKGKIASDIEALMKAEGNENNVPDNKIDINNSDEEKIGGKALLTDPYWNFASQSTYYRNRTSRLSNRTLKDVSLRDWLVSSIIQNRCDTAMRFTRVQHDRFKMGYRFTLHDHLLEMTDEDRKKIADLEQFIYNTGRTEKRPADSNMLFGEFCKKLVRDALTIGHVAIEKVKTRSGGLHRLQILPAESIYLASQTTPKEQLVQAIETGKNAYAQRKKNDENNENVVYETEESEYVKYVQVSIDDRPLAYFDDSNMIFKNFNPQNFIDGMGYSYSPLELAIINVTQHLNVENYNANFFTHGYAARGVLHLKGTVTQAQLVSFRRQFYNQISGSQNAWRTPIVAGLDTVEWVPLSGTNKEMEYINFNNHIMRSICTQFQIDPVELGMDFLTTSTGRAGNQQTNEQKISYSRERGLYPILMFIEDLINTEVIPAIDKDLAAKYKFEFVGYEDETPQTQIAQLQAEMSVHSSMNDLLRAAQKDILKDANGDIMPGANLPLNQAFWALVEKNFTRGEIRENFFGDKGASKRKELQYIPGDPAFLSWNQLLITIEQQKKQMESQQAQMQAQAQAQQQQAQQEQELQQGEHNRAQEKHNMEMEQAKNAAAHAAVNPQQMHDIASQIGSTKAQNVGGQTIANPINKIE